MNDILEIVISVLDRVYADHSYLIQNRVSERSIVFWFGIYFYELIQGTKYSEYDMDVEYNRNFQEVKRTENYPRGTFPDLILHKRGSNDSNIIIIEFKPWWNPGTGDDLKKLQDFTNHDGEYKYGLGLSILIDHETPNGKIVENGEVVGEF